MSEIIGKKIKSQLKAKGKTMAWLAERVPGPDGSGVSINAVSKWIKTGKIARENLNAVADALEMSVDELLSENKNPLDKKQREESPDVARTTIALRVQTPPWMAAEAHDLLCLYYALDEPERRDIMRLAESLQGPRSAVTVGRKK